MSSNPIFSRNATFNGQTGLLERPRSNPYQSAAGTGPGTYSQPQAHGTQAAPQAAGAQAAAVQGMVPQYSAQDAAAYGYVQQSGDRLTYEDVIVKTGVLFTILLAMAAIAWFVVPVQALGAVLIGGLVVAAAVFVITLFSKTISPLVAVIYSAAQGLVIGAVSKLFESLYNGVVFQAVTATLIVFGVSLFLFRSGKVRATSKFRKVLSVGLMSYVVFILGNFAFAMITGNSLRGGTMGLVVGFLAVILAAMSLISDFDRITTAVEAGAPRKTSWVAAFGLVVTLIWLYLELLRIIAILRD